MLLLKCQCPSFPERTLLALNKRAITSSIFIHLTSVSYIKRPVQNRVPKAVSRFLPLGNYSQLNQELLTVQKLVGDMSTRSFANFKIEFKNYIEFGSYALRAEIFETSE